TPDCTRSILRPHRAAATGQPHAAAARSAPFLRAGGVLADLEAAGGELVPDGLVAVRPLVEVDAPDRRADERPAGRAVDARARQLEALTGARVADRQRVPARLEAHDELAVRILERDLRRLPHRREQLRRRGPDLRLSGERGAGERQRDDADREHGTGD